MHRSYDALKGSPLLLRLAPVVGIVAFAAWVLGPLMRYGRVLLFHVWLPFMDCYLCLVFAVI